MASVLSATATLLYAPANAIFKSSVGKSLSGVRCPNFVPFVAFDASSLAMANTHLATVYFHRKTVPLIVFLASDFSRFRAYLRDESGDFADPLGNNGDDDEDSYEQEDYESTFVSESSDDGVEIEIVKTGKNSRRIISKVPVRATLQTVWDILTDYERLADFIPGLAVSQLVEKREKFARLFQIGEQNLALGLKFNAKGTIDCFEKDLEILPSGRKRDIEFKMVEGDFQLFEGKWSVEQEEMFVAGDLPSNSCIDDEYQTTTTTLVYIVNVKPKMWLPVRLVEGRLCKEIRKNLSCIREEAEKRFQITDSLL